MRMAARVLDGRAAATAIRAELAEEVEKLAAEGRRPTLAAVLVGADEASHIYAGSNKRAAERSGRGARPPPLAGVGGGDEEASHISGAPKQGAAERSGIGSRRVELPADAAQG